MFAEFFQANLIWFGLLFALFAMLFIDIQRNSLSGFKKVPAAQVPLLQRESAFLLDISSNKEFSDGHIAGSVNIPAKTFSVDDKTFKANKEEPVIIIDQTGMQASGVSKQLSKAGFAKIFVLDGGIAGWRKENFPLTTKTK